MDVTTWLLVGLQPPPPPASTMSMVVEHVHGACCLCAEAYDLLVNGSQWKQGSEVQHNVVWGSSPTDALKLCCELK